MLLDLRTQEARETGRAAPGACDRRHRGTDQRGQLSNVDANRKESEAMELKKIGIGVLGALLVVAIVLPVALIVAAAFGWFA